ncbi:hypothetical protein LUZ61_009096 [Rhynchospora tenuis]|uniref:AAA+ ATPase domain-containing protein n=1 Tax=Rhynchospora tenuis TaxID=198213 RepID=A0AAD5ZWL2_9POAL|nr:hypothetical protein LUZ61_009096 [Rhynchospora tenuis]
MELLKASVSLVPWIASKVAKHVAYPFKVSTNIKALESSLEQLDAQKRDVETTITNADRQNGTPTEQIKLWLREVEAIKQKAVEVSNKYQQQCRCIWNISPNLWSNYTISKRAAEQNGEVMNLCERGEKIPAFGHRASPLAEEMPVSSSNSFNLELAYPLITGYQKVQNIIGIWGMGGVGKTHLLKQLNNKLFKDGIFSVVMFVTCSKDCSEEKIQNEIINKFGLNKSNSKVDRRRTIFNFLNPKSFVLLLDDLWSEMDLESVGIPTPNCIGRIVVLTTRSEDVCRLMEVDEKMRVNVLDWNEAWSLFKGKVSEQTIESNPLILKYAVDIVKELGGLPLALITVGRAMHDRNDPSEWEHAVELLKRARLHEVELSGRDEPVFEVLKFSYDKLRDNNLRECFLHCSLWPEDHPIEKNDLVELWMGLGLINENSIDMAYNVGYNYIRMLQYACLLESTDNDSQVKLHDVIRDMSLWIISNEGHEQDKWIVRSRASNQSKVVIKDETEKISLMYHHADEVLLIPNFRDTRLTTFLFTSSCLSSSIPTLEIPILSFFNLTVLNLKQNKIAAFSTEICSLRNLQFVDLSDNEIESLPSEIGALVNMKYLYLQGNPICTIPTKAIYQMRVLKVLDLSPPYYYVNKEKQDKLNFVRSLLETLERLPEFGALGVELDNMEDMVRLCQLYVPVRWLTITMSLWQGSTFSFPSEYFVSFQPSKLFSLRLINIDVVDFIGTNATIQANISRGNSESPILKRLENLDICRVGMIKVPWGGLVAPKRFFPFLKCITISRCYDVQTISWVVHLPCLRELTVSGCPIIFLIYEYELSEPTFPLLKLLVLEGLPKLVKISNPKIIFPALETLKIFECNELEDFPFSANYIPPKLNHIWVEEHWWNAKWSQGLRSSLTEYVRFLY